MREKEREGCRYRARVGEEIEKKREQREKAGERTGTERQSRERL